MNKKTKQIFEVIWKFYPNQGFIKAAADNFESQIDEVLASLLQAERERCAKEKETLDAGLELMDKARDILTKGEPTPDNNWGMLDTKYLRKDLKAIRED